MLTKPGISDDRISACLHDRFGLRIAHVTFLHAQGIRQVAAIEATEEAIYDALKL
jgi:hypothetical protein